MSFPVNSQCVFVRVLTGRERAPAPARGRKVEGSGGDTAAVRGGEQQQGRPLGSFGPRGCARVDRGGRGGNEHAAAPRHPSDGSAGTEQQSRGQLWLRSDSAWWRTVAGAAAQATGTTPMRPRRSRGGERGHRSHDRQGQGRRASGITSTRGLRSGGATATQWRCEAADGGGTDHSVVGSTTMRGRRRVAPMRRCRSSGQRLPRGEVSSSDDDRRCEVPRGERGRR